MERHALHTNARVAACAVRVRRAEQVTEQVATCEQLGSGQGRTRCGGLNGACSQYGSMASLAHVCWHLKWLQCCRYASWWRQWV